MSPQPKDYYRILEVPESADGAAIKKAYRKLAKRFHPDANPGSAEAAERFKEIGEAYGILSDSEKRAEYDQMRRLGAFGGGRGGSGGFSPEDVSGFGGFGDLFSSLFDRGAPGSGDGGGGGGARGGRRRGPSRGADVELSVEVPFETAARGGRIQVQVPVTESCAVCSGSGARPGSSVRSCSECRGAGQVTFAQGGFAVQRPCPVCGGRGQTPEIPCGSCAGSGSTRRHRAISVTIPEALEDGARMRIPGQGEPGTAPGVPGGDLLLSLRVRPDRFFRREGLDLHVTVPVNVAQAILGSRLRVRTLGGEKVELAIPPGTQPGSRLRLPGLGIRKGGRTGDQWVEISVKLPEALDEEGREALRAFARQAGLPH
jgi:molecular chaperone DnaJ